MVRFNFTFLLVLIGFSFSLKAFSQVKNKNGRYVVERITVIHDETKEERMVYEFYYDENLKTEAVSVLNSGTYTIYDIAEKPTVKYYENGRPTRNVSCNFTLNEDDLVDKMYFSYLEDTLYFEYNIRGQLVEAVTNDYVYCNHFHWNNDGDLTGFTNPLLEENWCDYVYYHKKNTTNINLTFLLSHIGTTAWLSPVFLTDMVGAIPERLYYNSEDISNHSIYSFKNGLIDEIKDIDMHMGTHTYKIEYKK